jgi:hypothetical protein
LRVGDPVFWHGAKNIFGKGEKMDTSYKSERVDLEPGEHSDAKEVNDLVNALVDNNGSKAKEAVEAITALYPDMTEDDRFLHLWKVMNGVLSNQLQARFLEPKTPG